MSEIIGLFIGNKLVIKNRILNLRKNVKIDDNDSLFEFYKQLLKCKHNLLHFCVLDSMCKPWEDEISVRLKLNLDDDCELLNKTPDIIIQNLDYVSLIDVSISLDNLIYEKIKQEKYLPVCDYLQLKYNYKVEFIHINVNITFGNVEKEVYKINKYQKRDFDIQYFTSCADILRKHVDWVSRNINKRIF